MKDDTFVLTAYRGDRMIMAFRLKGGAVFDHPTAAHPRLHHPAVSGRPAHFADFEDLFEALRAHDDLDDLLGALVDLGYRFRNTPADSVEWVFRDAPR